MKQRLSIVCLLLILILAAGAVFAASTGSSAKGMPAAKKNVSPAKAPAGGTAGTEKAAPEKKQPSNSEAKPASQPEKKPAAQPAKNPADAKKASASGKPAGARTIHKFTVSNSANTFLYRITWQDKVAGYSKFAITKKMELAGKDYFKIESVCELKIGMGYVEPLTFKGQMTIDGDKYQPNFFAAYQKQGNVEMGVDCLISDNLIAQKNVSKDEEMNNVITIPDGKKLYIYMNNLWGRADTLVEHAWTLVRSGKTGKIFVYDPVLQQTGEMTLEITGTEPVEINGQRTTAKVYVLKDFNENPLFTLLVDKAGRILRLEETGGGITFELTGNEKIIGALKDLPGVDIWKDRVSLVDIYLANPRDINMLKATVIAKGRGFIPEETVAGLNQTFTGTRDQGTIEGEFQVSSADIRVAKPLAFPVPENLPPELAPFTKPEMGIESTEDFIHNKALEVTWKSKDSLEAGQKIATWIATSIPQGISLPSAKITLANEQGNSESKALLAVALCRTVGIPARKAGGVVFYGGNFIPHYWFEVYAADGTWVALDPTYNEITKLDATHIKLFSSGEIWSLNVTVNDYAPKPPEQVSYINRELVWPVGEERVYAVKKKGEKIGEEIVKMTEVGVVNDVEGYRMSLSTLLKNGDKEIGGTGDYWMTPQGLPIKFTSQTGDSVQKETHDFLVKGTIIEQDSKTIHGDIKRKIPLSKGTYLADSLYLSQWALIAGQFPDLAVGKTYLFHVFIPETLNTVMIQAQVKTIESVEAGEKIYDAYRVETGQGITFWMEKGTGKVLKISFKEENVDLELTSSKFKL